MFFHSLSFSKLLQVLPFLDIHGYLWYWLLCSDSERKQLGSRKDAWPHDAPMHLAFHEANGSVFFLSCAAYDPFSRFLPNWQSHDSEQFRRNGVICLNSSWSCTRELSQTISSTENCLGVHAQEMEKERARQEEQAQKEKALQQWSLVLWAFVPPEARSVWFTTIVVIAILPVCFIALHDNIIQPHVTSLQHPYIRITFLLKIIRIRRHPFFWLHLGQEELEKLRDELRRQRQLQEDHGYPWVAKGCRDQNRNTRDPGGLQ